MANTRFATESGVHVVVEGLIGAEAGGRGGAGGPGRGWEAEGAVAREAANPPLDPRRSALRRQAGAP